MKIAIIGHGFVGQAVDYGFSGVDKIIIDPKFKNEDKVDENCYSSIEEYYDDHRSFQDRPNYVFVCVPTPMDEDGAINAKHIWTTLNAIEIYWQNVTVIIKSTVVPGILEKAYDLFRVPLCYNPEFLTERASKDDFVNPPFHIFGANHHSINDNVELLYKKYSMCVPCPVHKMLLKEAAYVKYGINTFLATKITFLNQLKDTIDNDNADRDLSFQTVVNAICADPRIGYSHSRVPGFDGKPGFGGACFPKDVSALINYYDDLSLLEQVHKINVDYRKDLELDDREREQNVTF